MWQDPRLELAQDLLHDVIDVFVANSNQYIASRLLPIWNHILEVGNNTTVRFRQTKPVSQSDIRKFSYENEMLTETFYCTDPRNEHCCYELTGTSFLYEGDCLTFDLVISSDAREIMLLIRG